MVSGRWGFLSGRRVNRGRWLADIQKIHILLTLFFSGREKVLEKSRAFHNLAVSKNGILAQLV